MAKKYNKKTGFEWDVQPYRWLYELRDQYISETMVATRKDAQDAPEKITAWMKQHAVWQDKSGDARRGLRAEFVTTTLEGEDQIQYEREKSQAIRAEDRLLKEMNRERKRAGAIPLAQVPNRLSPAFAFNQRLAAKQEERRKTQIIFTLLITHDDRLTYAIWLEIANQGRFGIISRTYDYWNEKLFNRVKSIANLVQYNFVFEPGRTKKEEFDLVASQPTETGETYQPWSEEVKAERNRRAVGYRRTKRQREGGVRKKWSKGPVRPFSNRRR